MSRVLIKDIARELGVSTATVSLVLSGKAKEGRVSKILAEKVKAKAEEMNYKPNSLARSLRVGKTNTIGLVVADISNPFFASLAFHIQENAEKHGYIVIMTNTSENSEKMEKMINALRGRQVDGLIVVPTAYSESYIETLVSRKEPLVLLDRSFPNLPVSHVLIDNYQASFEATKHLVDIGCKRIALFLYDNQLVNMEERERGYVNVLKAHDVYDSSLVCRVSYDNLEADVNRGLTALLKAKKNRIDGVFFATNSISLFGIKVLFDNGLDIPKDIRVVCFDKNDAFEFSKSRIPYISQPIAEMGKIVVDTLVSQIETPSFSSKVMVSATLENI